VQSARWLQNSATAALGGAAELRAMQLRGSNGLDCMLLRGVPSTWLHDWLAGWLAATSASVLWLGRQCLGFLRCAEARVVSVCGGQIGIMMLLGELRRAGGRHLSAATGSNRYSTFAAGGCDRPVWAVQISVPCVAASVSIGSPDTRHSPALVGWYKGCVKKVFPSLHA
jgi:hypothetical protein